MLFIVYFIGSLLDSQQFLGSSHEKTAKRSLIMVQLWKKVPGGKKPFIEKWNPTDHIEHNSTQLSSNCLFVKKVEYLYLTVIHNKIAKEVSGKRNYSSPREDKWFRLDFTFLWVYAGTKKVLNSAACVSETLGHRAMEFRIQMSSAPLLTGVFLSAPQPWRSLGGQREHVFQSAGPVLLVLLTYCFTEVVSFPRQTHVPLFVWVWREGERLSLCEHNGFLLPTCEIMFNLEDQYVRINPSLGLYLKKMFNKCFVTALGFEEILKEGICSGQKRSMLL